MCYSSCMYRVALLPGLSIQISPAQLASFPKRPRIHFSGDEQPLKLVRKSAPQASYAEAATKRALRVQRAAPA